MINKIYLAGPISNNPNFKNQFELAQKDFELRGCIVLNPAILPKGLSQEEYMKICIPMLNIAEGVCFLKGWESSVGAKIEHALAIQSNKKIFYQN